MIILRLEHIYKIHSSQEGGNIVIHTTQKRGKELMSWHKTLAPKYTLTKEHGT